MVTVKASAALLRIMSDQQLMYMLNKYGVMYFVNKEMLLMTGSVIVLVLPEEWKADRIRGSKIIGRYKL